jgi:hypothetical protein
VVSGRRSWGRLLAGLRAPDGWVGVAFFAGLSVGRCHP